MDSSFDIAIIGISCRFPGAENIFQFWENLKSGKESITHFNDDELKEAGVPAFLIKNPHYEKASPVLKDPGLFDAEFFGYTPAEAKMLDPQQRIMLECAYNALENSGWNPENFDGRIGVFTGSALNTYFMNKILRAKFIDEYIPTLIGNDKDFLSTRISYKMNLKGPSINVQTACSTSIVAVHLGCQSLITRESDMVIAGAVSVKVPHNSGYLSDGGGIVSPDAHVRTFDAKANGTVFGSGCGVVVLKRMTDALRDGDTIHVVIKASAVNNDGSEKAGYTAPAVNSQAECMTEAISLSEIDPETITFVEAHGSGTPIGDPIEFSAMTKAFRNFTEKKSFCAVGSVKANIGHLDAAAGMAGLIKTVLSLENKSIPPAINFSEPNPAIDFSRSALYINTSLKPWESNGPRRAAVISTGMGGTNASLILEEAPLNSRPEIKDSTNLFLLSAKNEKALEETSKNLSDYFRQNYHESLRNSAYTLQTGRKFFKNRMYFTASDSKELISVLAGENSKKKNSGLMSGNYGPVIFMLPGVGDHYIGMGYELYKNVNFFKNEVDRCADILLKYLDTDIRDILYPENFIRSRTEKPAGIDLKKMLAGRNEKLSDPDSQKLNQTIFVQPVLFTIEYSLAKLWMHLGIMPDLILSHSMGEYTAACLAGVLSLEDALRIIAKRAVLVNNLPPGRMLAVNLPEKELNDLLTEGISISLINSPGLCVIAGTESDINKFESLLDEKKILYRHVQNGHAFHSRMLDPVKEEFSNELKKIKLNKPLIPFSSNLTGNWISETDAVDPLYWIRHLTNPARFSECLENAWQATDPVFIEIGPGNTLSVLAMQHPAGQNNKYLSIQSLRQQYDNNDDYNFFLNSIGKFWLSGKDLKWDNLYNEKPRRIPLPGYPFQKQNYWIESVPDIPAADESDEVIHKTTDISRWYYVPSWKRMIPVTTDFSNEHSVNRTWLVFADSDNISSEIISRLLSEGQDVITASPGKEFKKSGDSSFVIHPGDPGSYESLIRKLREAGRIPRHIIHAWNISENVQDSYESFEEMQLKGFYSLIYLTKALSRNKINSEIRLFILSDGIQEVTGSERITPGKATMLGPCMVIPQEHNNINTKSIDLQLRDFETGDGKLFDRIMGEFLAEETDRFVAYRSGHRWVQNFENIEIKKSSSPVFRNGGVYLVTGGLGEVCYLMSEHIAAKYKARLVLVNRTELPERKGWKPWLLTHQDDDNVSIKIRRIMALESAGSEVLYFNADAADEEAMRIIVQKVYEEFGIINGVIHGAGIVGSKGFSSIQEIDPGKCEAHFNAKVKALYTLRKVLEGKEIDFCMLMSSLTPILGGLRESAYSASNLFMDSFSRKFSRDDKIPWISINWDLWRTQNTNGSDHHLGKTLSELGILPAEGIQALETVLSVKNVPQIIVSTGDLNARVNQWVKLESLEKGFLTQGLSSEDSQTGSLENETEKPEDDTEKRMLRIWKEVLGTKDISKDDNFFELGGHSLLAIQLISAIRKGFGIDIGLDDIFNSVTLSEMARKVDDMIAAMEASQ